MTANDTATALRTLHERGTHLARFRRDRKAPIAAGWLDKPEPIGEVLKHAEHGGRVGMVLGSVGLVVVDVDHGDPADVTAAHGPPLVSVPSATSGHWHLFYKSPGGGVPSWNWAIGEAKGELRGTNGGIILYDPGAVVAIEANGAAPLDVAKPRAKPPWVQATGVEAVRTASKGERNNVLFREAARAIREAAIANGLSPAEVDRTIRSAADSVPVESYQSPRLAPRDDVDEILSTLRRRAEGGFAALIPESRRCSCG